jgi:preprotein translocase subunit SecF
MIGQTMRSFRLIPDDTHIPFVRYQYWAYAFSGALILLTLILLPTKGLNLGIDFQGGILIEVGMPGPADLAAMRSILGDLGLGEVALQDFGGRAYVLIRVQRQEGAKRGSSLRSTRSRPRSLNASVTRSAIAGSNSSAQRSARTCSGAALRRRSMP